MHIKGAIRGVFLPIGLILLKFLRLHLGLLKKFYEHTLGKLWLIMVTRSLISGLGTFMDLKTVSKEEILYLLLVKERGYYQAIRDITQQEAKQLTAQSSNEISSLLKKKKILMTCIQEIENALIPLKKYWNHKVDRTDFFSRQIEQELVLLNHLLKEILQMDLLSQRALKNHMHSLQEKSKIQ